MAMHCMAPSIRSGRILLGCYHERVPSVITMQLTRAEASLDIFVDCVRDHASGYREIWRCLGCSWR